MALYIVQNQNRVPFAIRKSLEAAQQAAADRIDHPESKVKFVWPDWSETAYHSGIWRRRTNIVDFAEPNYKTYFWIFLCENDQKAN
jgi:hypothetical protein